MSIQTRGLGRIALSLTLAAVPALAQAAAPAATAASAPAPSAEILPVPLNPVVPAAQRQCSAKTASGLGTRLLRDAQAAKPGQGDFVLVNYIGYLAADGTVFDQNVTQAFATGAVIKGFSEGLLTMSKGSVWRFCIPAALGYGEKATGPIPANSDLVFQVELVDFKSQAEVEAMRAEAQKQAAQEQAGQQQAGQQQAGQQQAGQQQAGQQQAGQAPAPDAAAPAAGKSKN